MKITVVIKVENDSYKEPEESAEAEFHVSSLISEAHKALDFAVECMKPGLVQSNRMMNKRIEEAINARKDKSSSDTSGK